MTLNESDPRLPMYFATSAGWPALSPKPKASSALARGSPRPTSCMLGDALAMLQLCPIQCVLQETTCSVSQGTGQYDSGRTGIRDESERQCLCNVVIKDGFKRGRQKLAKARGKDVDLRKPVIPAWKDERCESGRKSRLGHLDS